MITTSFHNRFYFLTVPYLKRPYFMIRSIIRQCIEETYHEIDYFISLAFTLPHINKLAAKHSGGKDLKTK